MYVCLAVACHLHFWQNDQDLLHASADGGGTDNKMQLGGGGGGLGVYVKHMTAGFQCQKKQKPWHSPQTYVVDRFYVNFTLQVVQAADKFSGHQPELTPQGVM